MEKVLCLRMFYRWKIITSKNYFPCLLFASGTYEIDFVVVDKTKILELIQVTYKMDTAKTRNRELGGLAKGYAGFKCDKLTLISLNERGEEEYEGAKIKKVTVVDWLLGNVL